MRRDQRLSAPHEIWRVLTEKSVRIRPVILSGGVGTRLWPASRASYPKQLLSIAEPATMMQATMARVQSPDFALPIIVANEGHKDLVKSQVDQMGLKAEAIILEPQGRNTAAAIALVAHLMSSSGSDDYLLVMPSDHVIADVSAFHRAIDAARDAAGDGALVTFGITPTSPATGYGYIEAGPTVGASLAVRTVRRFVEKPDLASAEAYLASGDFYWNAGIFLFKASAIRDELQKLAPDIFEKCADAMSNRTTDDIFVRPEASAFLACENISIDYAVMEKTDRARVVPLDMGWSDVGSWDALWGISAKDSADNVSQGDILAIDTHGSLLRSDCDAQITTVGVSNMIVVATRDAVLVAPRERAEDVKLIVDALKKTDSLTHQMHAKVQKPWGSYETMDRGHGFQVKRIIVTPGHQLSLQFHHRRSEHWVVVDGSAEVTIGESVSTLNANESAHIPVGVVHRLANRGTKDLHLIEVQCGDYLGEDDIVRLEDTYGRAGTVGR